MGLDERDKEMMALSVPTVDLFEMREDLAFWKAELEKSRVEKRRNEKGI